MDRAHMNLILDTRMYQVEFAGGKVTELTMNVIAELICTQFDADRNENLLLDVLVYYHKNNKAISLPAEQTRIQGRPVTCKTTEGWQNCCQWKNSSIV